MSIFSVNSANAGKYNKITNKIRGGGAYCTNNIAQKCLSAVVSLTLIFGISAGNLAQAAEPTTFAASALSSHWGRSDLRAYLNNVNKTGDTLPLDTTIDGTNSGNFPAKFSDAEFALVQPFTYQTNVFDTSTEHVKSIYETTDRFWLLSGNNSAEVVIWGSEDISTDAQCSKNKDRIINTRSFFVNSNSMWLRSPNKNNTGSCFVFYPGRLSTRYTRSLDYICVAFKIDLNPVIFASAASAFNLTSSDRVQVITNSNLYLKTLSDKNFTANSITNSGNNLTVSYTGGEASQYIVVQAFKDEETTSYEANKLIEAGQSSASIDITAWGIDSLDGYTVKVWMEDTTGSLAKATLPTTFVGTTKTESGAVKNGRVFAMKEDLQSSWGSLANATDLVGEGATNQKIYFGSHAGKPLEFWIAGRETAANGGDIDPSGNIMTLITSSPEERRAFNANCDYNYNVEGKPAVTLRLTQDPINASYDGQTKAYPADKITTANLVEGYTLKWQQRKAGDTAWNDGMPTLGTCEVRCYAPGTDNYERTYNNVVNFVIKKTPKPSDFTFSHPKDMAYDGKGKVITIEPKPGITGMGALTVKYYKVNSGGILGAASTTPPTDAGRYKVKFDVADGTEYGAATDLPAMF